jgi:hypothetical protein
VGRQFKALQMADKKKQDRLTIDIGDLREDIERCRQDAAWEELSLAGKIRTLIKERIEQLLDAQAKKSDE